MTEQSPGNQTSDQEASRSESYDPRQAESLVQKEWDDSGIYVASENSEKQKFYCLSMFPYPSGQLHMGHVRNYTLGDVIGRYQRLQGKNVRQRMGWEGFGLRAENAAIKNNGSGQKGRRENIEHRKNQVKNLGDAYDWSCELATGEHKDERWERWV